MSESSQSSSSRLHTPETDDFVMSTSPVYSSFSPEHSEPILSLDELLLHNAFDTNQPPTYHAPLVPAKAIPPPAPISRRTDPSLIHRKTVHPERNTSHNLSLVFPTLPSIGTKSRVETQIRVVMDLTDTFLPSEPLKYNRVGSWKWLKLPDGTATKKRMRKQAKFDPPQEETLFMTSSVSCASPPYSSVFCCTGCQNREAKRVAKKIAARVKPQYSDSDNPDAESPSTKKPFQEDTSSILHFNCAQVLEFSTGTATLPMRLTCYCRHHKEKTGFNVHITLIDHIGRIVAKGSTPHIMITDDHKTMLARQSEVPSPIWTSPTATPGELTGNGGPDARGKGTAKSSRKRAKPYETTKPHGPPRDHSESSPSSSSIALPYPPPTRPPTPLSLDQFIQLESQPPGQTPPLQGSSLDSESSLDAISTPLDYQSDAPMVSMADDSVLHTSVHILPTHPHAIPFLFGDLNTPTALPIPSIHRLIPSTGPTHGGIEVTILGVNFHPSLSFRCVFGDVVSTSAQRWSDNTLVCILPPRCNPGVVQVYLDGFPASVDASTSSLFTYTSESDRTLMELALQVVGLKMTGKLEDAKDVAMRIVGTSGSDTPDLQTSAPSMQFSSLLDTEDLESTIVGFLGLLDSGPSVLSPELALSIRNASGQNLVHLAAFSGYSNLLDIILKHNIDLDVRDRNGFTALHFSVLSGHHSIVCGLLAAGADPTVVDACGKIPQEIASQPISALFPSDSTDSGEDDDEAQWGDVEDEASSPPTPIRPRRLRRPFGRISASQSRPSSPEELASQKHDERKSEFASEKQAESLVEMIQRTLGDKIPGAQGIMENIPAIPHFLTLPQMLLPQNIPVHPAQADERAQGTVAALHDLRATWEKWFAVAAALAMRQADDPPPEYTPRIEEEPPIDVKQPPTCQVAESSNGGARVNPHSRVDYDGTNAPPSNEVAAYGYQPTRKHKEKLQKKEDRMLLLFWIPVLFISLLWGLQSSIRFAFTTLRSAIPSGG